jgi:hypothetical protein
MFLILPCFLAPKMAVRSTESTSGSSGSPPSSFLANEKTLEMANSPELLEFEKFSIVSSEHEFSELEKIIVELLVAVGFVCCFEGGIGRTIIVGRSGLFSGTEKLIHCFHRLPGPTAEKIIGIPPCPGCKTTL